MTHAFLRTELERETQRCGGCDCFETEDGCECREVSCIICGKINHIYNMEHPDKHKDDWCELPFEDKLNGFYCEDCGIDTDEEYDEFSDSDG